MKKKPQTTELFRGIKKVIELPEWGFYYSESHHKTYVAYKSSGSKLLLGPNIQDVQIH